MANSRKETGAGRSPVRSVIGLIVSVIGLWAGFGILELTGRAADMGSGQKALRIVFAIVWFLFWLGALLYHALNLWSRSRAKGKGPSPAGAAGAPRPEAQGEKPADFETRLRGLESLRKDGLISEEEYRAKRENLMRENW